MSRFPDEGRCSSRSRSPPRDEREGSSPRDARLDDVFRHAKPHRDVAIVTAGIDAPEITRGIGKVFLLPTSSARVAVKRYRAVTWQRSPERPDATGSGNSTTARSAARRTAAARPIRPSYVFRTWPRDEGDSDAANVNSVPHGSKSKRHRPRLSAHRRTSRSSLMVNRGSTTSAGSMPRVFAGIHRMMLLLGGTGLGRGGFFRLLLCVSFG